MCWTFTVLLPQASVTVHWRDITRRSLSVPVVSRSAKEVFDTRVAASVQLSAWPVGSPVTDGSAEMACDGCTRHSVSSAGAVNVGFTVSLTVTFCV